MYDDLRLHQTFTEGNYFHLDVELKWLRGVRLHRDVRFKFFRDNDVAGLEFRCIPEWPVVFQVWPGHLVDTYGPYFVISTADTERKAIAQLDADGLTLVGDIAEELFSIISSLTNNPAADIRDAQAVLREVIRVSDYIATGNSTGNSAGHAPLPHGTSVAPAQLRLDPLQPIVALLAENQKLLDELQAVVSTGREFDVLDSYLARIRVDGVPKHAHMKRQLEQIAENNTAIVTLIKVYAPHAKSAAFTAQGDRFRSYAMAWRERWNSVLELVTAGGHFTPADIAFPHDFAAAVAAERAT